MENQVNDSINIVEASGTDDSKHPFDAETLPEPTEANLTASEDETEEVMTPLINDSDIAEQSEVSEQNSVDVAAIVEVDSESPINSGENSTEEFLTAVSTREEDIVDVPESNIKETGVSNQTPEEIAAHPEDMRMSFLPYNTDMERLRLPEYGRKIQELIQYCKGIPDREERTACAYAISDVMARLFPNVVGEQGNRQKIWDHINIMAGFELDIEFPVKVLSSEDHNPKPKKIEYNKKPIRFRHYGRTLELMIEKTAEMEDSEQKDHLILLIANQMKKQLLAHNKEGVSDAKVLKDLADYSRQRIVLDPQLYRLHEYNEVNNKQPLSKKKRKK